MMLAVLLVLLLVLVLGGGGNGSVGGVTASPSQRRTAKSIFYNFGMVCPKLDSQLQALHRPQAVHSLGTASSWWQCWREVVLVMTH